MHLWKFQCMVSLNEHTMHTTSTHLTTLMQNIPLKNGYFICYKLPYELWRHRAPRPLNRQRICIHMPIYPRKKPLLKMSVTFKVFILQWIDLLHHIQQFPWQCRGTVIFYPHLQPIAHSDLNETRLRKCVWYKMAF